MSGLVTTGEKNLVLVSGRAHMDLAHAVGEEIGCGVSPVTAYDFASGEIYVRFNESVRGADVFVLQSIEGDINKWIMEQLIMIRRYQARLREAHRRGRSPLPVLASGQEAPGPRAYLRSPHG